MEEETKVCSFRLNQAQMQRLRSIASYWGFGTDTEIVQWALNLLEKRITSQETSDLIATATPIKKINDKLERMKRAIADLKRNTKNNENLGVCNTKAENRPDFID